MASSYNSIGLVYANKSEHDKALEYYQKSLAIKLKQLGTDHPSVAITYNNMAFVSKALKDLPKAKEFGGEASTGLLHTRLSIIDLSDQGAHPMQSECGQIYVT